MAKIRSWGEEYVFKCPGCKCDHVITPKVHTFSGDFDKPTLSPSVLYINKPRCHSFVVDGNIQFLSDCEHDLVGQTVELPEI